MKKIIVTLTLLLALNSFSQVLQEGFEDTTGPNASPSIIWPLASGNWSVFDNGNFGNTRWGINNTPSIPPLVNSGVNAAYMNRVNVGAGNTSEHYLATPAFTVPINDSKRIKKLVIN